jgi:hypothetical protein
MRVISRQLSLPLGLAPRPPRPRKAKAKPRPKGAMITTSPKRWGYAKMTVLFMTTSLSKPRLSSEEHAATPSTSLYAECGFEDEPQGRHDHHLAQAVGYAKITRFPQSHASAWWVSRSELVQPHVFPTRRAPITRSFPHANPPPPPKPAAGVPGQRGEAGRGRCL